MIKKKKLTKKQGKIRDELEVLFTNTKEIRALFILFESGNALVVKSLNDLKAAVLSMEIEISTQKKKLQEHNESTYPTLQENEETKNNPLVG